MPVSVDLLFEVFPTATAVACMKYKENNKVCGFLAVLMVFNRKNKFKWQHPVISQLFVDHYYVLWGPSVTEKPGLENLLSFDSLLLWGHRFERKERGKEKTKHK